MKILLAVTGGIAAYKACDLASKLTQRGHQVQVLLSEAAQEFITPLTFRELTGFPTHHDQFAEPKNWQMEHISLARWADLMVVAPATANSIAKFAHGLADDLLSTVALATKAPILLAPAMNSAMYSHPATGENIKTLKQRGVHFVGPGIGRLACGEEGPGRLAQIEEIVAAIESILTPKLLQGRKVLITAGPTQEPLDPFRFISNYSTGKMGYALAEAAAQLGAAVTLVSGPTTLPAPLGVERIMVQQAREMHREVLARFPEQDVVVKAAAVSDWQSKTQSPQKMKKGSAQELSLTLVPTVDILKELGKQKTGQYLVGFAAETENLARYAQEKLVEKGCEMIIANEIGRPGSGFASETNQVLIITGQGQEALLQMPKKELAMEIWQRIVKNLKEGGR